jgi:hypothetical protein
MFIVVSSEAIGAYNNTGKRAEAVQWKPKGFQLKSRKLADMHVCNVGSKMSMIEVYMEK